jgi:hypothetical protein
MPKPFVLLIFLLSSFLAAYSAPSEDGGRERGVQQWFQTLTIPGTQLPCCSIADCRRVGYRVDGGSHQVLIHGQWYMVPDGTVLRRENPTGDAIACYTGAGYAPGATPVPPYISSPETDEGVIIRCFVPAAGV